MPSPTYPVLSAANLPFGARVLTINALTYIAEDFSYEQTSVTAERQTELGAPNGIALNKGARTGSAKCQLALSTTALPEVGHTFVADTFTFLVLTVGKQESHNGFTVVPITFREQI